MVGSKTFDLGECNTESSEKVTVAALNDVLATEIQSLNKPEIRMGRARNLRVSSSVILLHLFNN